MSRTPLTAIVLVVALGQTAVAEEQLIFDYDAVMACMDDAEKLCKVVVPGGGGMESCIRQNFSNLTPGCAKEFTRIVAEQSPLPRDQGSSRPPVGGR